MFNLPKKPELDAPLLSWIPKLVSSGVDGLPYNVVRYGDILWGISWEEPSFNADTFLAGKSNGAIIVGDTLEEISCGIKLLKHTPPKNAVLRRINRQKEKIFKKLKLRPAPKQIAGLDMVSKYIYRLTDNTRKNLIVKNPRAIGLKNRALPTNNLFEAGDGKPIVIVSPCPSRSCNYRCSYCFNHHEHGFKKNKSATESWSKALLTAVERIPRPLILSMGSMGEPLFSKIWRETTLKVLSYPKVQNISFVSNLVMNPKEFISKVDPKRVGVVGSLHPSEFKDYERDLDLFLKRITYLKDFGVSVTVNYVLTPEQIKDFPKYKKMLNELGIPLISNILRGPYQGKNYPESYLERDLKNARQYQSEIPFVNDFQSRDKSPYGVKCITGRWAFHLEFDGTIYNCDYAREKIGSIYDDKVMLRTKNCFCTATECDSQVMIGFMEEVAKKYKVQRSMHHFDIRTTGELGEHPYV